MKTITREQEIELINKAAQETMQQFSKILDNIKPALSIHATLVCLSKVNVGMLTSICDYVTFKDDDKKDKDTLPSLSKTLITMMTEHFEVIISMREEERQAKTEVTQ